MKANLSPPHRITGSALACGGAGLRAAAAFVVLGIVCPGSAVAAERPTGKATPPRSLRSTTDAQSVPLDVPVLRMRVETPEGVLVVFDATSLLHVGEGCSGYLAYWLSAQDTTPYVFPAVLHKDGDLATALLVLERDIGVDLEALADMDDRVDGALRSSSKVPNEEIVWEPATLRRAVEIMGFDAGDDSNLPEPGDGQTAGPCDPSQCPESPSPPSDCGSPGGLAREALSVVAGCCLGGGVTPPSPPLPPPPSPPPCECCWVRISGELIFITADGTVTPAGNCCSFSGCCDFSGPCGGSGEPCHCCPLPVASGAEGPDSTVDDGALPSRPTRRTKEETLRGEGSTATDNCCLGGWCDDGDPCTFGDNCNRPWQCPSRPAGTCCGVPMVCPDDGNPCTDDYCSDGRCIHPAITGSCPDDGIFCNGVETCVVGMCRSGGNPCLPEQFCDEEHNACVWCVSDTDCDDGKACTRDSCLGWASGFGGVAKGKCVNESLCPQGQSCCAGGACCDLPCEECLNYGYLSGGTITVTPDPPVVCVGDSITFTASGVSDRDGTKRENCQLVANQVTPTYTWRITKPDGTTVPPADQPPGSDNIATVVADQPGTYSCTFTATANRECAPAPLTLPLSAVNVHQSATLSADPTAIPAKTGWPGMPPWYVSDITVTWDPPECEGTLKILDFVGDSGYTPPNKGTLGRTDATKWRYTAFDEAQTEFCPKAASVPIAAMQGDTELARLSIRVLPVHTWWTHGHKHGPGGQTHPPDTSDFTNDYNFLRWKYAAVLATTGGTFAGPPSISTNTCVSCGLGLPPPCVPACTDIFDSVDFGTSAFTQSENATASTIGHELVHTVGVANQSECTAYTWEFNHDTGTGIFQCDTSYLANVVQMMNCKCSGINCP